MPGVAGAKNIVIVDLDGTLANDDHRVHLLRGENAANKRWDEYFRLCGGDTVNHPIAQLVRLLYMSKKQIYIFSGRSDIVKAETEKWLMENNIPYEALIMRGKDDRTDDNELKIRWAERLRDRIWIVLEDRNRVVKAWRDAGYTCLQVAEGNF